MEAHNATAVICKCNEMEFLWRSIQTYVIHFSMIFFLGGDSAPMDSCSWITHVYKGLITFSFHSYWLDDFSQKWSKFVCE